MLLAIHRPPKMRSKSVKLRTSSAASSGPRHARPTNAVTDVGTPSIVCAARISSIYTPGYLGSGGMTHVTLNGSRPDTCNTRYQVIHPRRGDRRDPAPQRRPRALRARAPPRPATLWLRAGAGAGARGRHAHDGGHDLSATAAA